jgi:hypothetical protein
MPPVNASELDRTAGSSHLVGAVDIYWLPLGAGADVVRISGELYEAASARLQRRASCDLYHSALEIQVPEGRFVVEQTPVPDAHRQRRGVVAQGPVGLRLAGRIRLFQYEVRRWRDGAIPDVDHAVASPVRLTDDPTRARSVLDVLPTVPRLIWGRDESKVGEMWNSNSVIAWALARGGFDVAAIRPPAAGRAPGWEAGRLVAGRDFGQSVVSGDLE